MEKRTLSTRVALIYKSYSEWEAIKDTFIPLRGEVCYCEIPSKVEDVDDYPTLLFKVGDGTNSFSKLPWDSGLAADVYAWAKKENLEFIDLSDDFKEALEEFIGQHAVQVDNKSIEYISDSGLSIKDYNIATQGQMVVKDSVAGLTWVDPVSDDSLQRAVAAAEASKNQAGNYSVQAGNSASEANTAAQTAARINQVTMDWINEKFWWGTISEYNNLEKITEGTFYFLQV